MSLLESLLRQSIAIACAGICGARSDVSARQALDELQMWRMAPFVEAVIGQQCADFSVRLAGQLMRARHEFVRSRTKQRGFLRFQDVSAPSPSQ
mmetsp:Transcript_9931/g.17883  ORF Transcript_9931/g.17883 Transcript_9931/m.17883 type:complete len:94 (+) Transcript_9931:577-858(+)